MTAVTLTWLQSDDATPAGTLSFTSLIPGTPSAAQTVHLWNGQGDATVEDATELLLTALQRDPGETDWEQDGSLAALRWVEIRAVGQAGTGISAQTTPWTPVGRNRYLSLMAIPGDCTRYLEVRVNVPAGAGTQDLEVLIRPYYAEPAQPIESGHYESGANGVRNGIGDTTFSALLSGGAITPNAPADDKVDIADLIWIHEGVPKAKLLHELTISNLDKNAAALVAGEAYWNTLSAGSGATITETKSAKGTAPLATSLREAVPDGELLVGYVHRDFDAAIAAGDIYQEDKLLGCYAYQSASGLVATLGPGHAIVDNTLIRHDRTQTATLTAASTNRIWLLPSGGLGITTTAAAPTDRALLLWELVTDGSTVTSSVDRRLWLGPRLVPISFRWGATLAATQKQHAIWPEPRSGWIRALGGVVFGLDDQGSGTASGATTADLELSNAGAAFATVFTSQGTADRRPSIAYNASDPTDRDAVPEVYEIPAFARLRGEIDAIPGGGTAPTGAKMMVLVEVP
ncbi:MAG: hypothetical protein A2Y38_13290 [Spirochaetes bacterium GWB1_59_5]|nr:MAG: hypothetical protein A2Y38_13290 [Spirochaetes bacterium GWB1_59_5]